MGVINGALANLKAYRLRASVTIVWIVLGIISVIMVSSVGDGLEALIDKSYDTEENRTVTLEYYSSNNSSSKFLQPFSKQAIEAISLVNGVEKIDASGEKSQSGGSLHTTLFVGNKESNTRISHYSKEMLDIICGRPFGYEDDERNSIIIDDIAASQLFGSCEEAIGNPIKLEGINFEIIGVFKNSENIDETGVISSQSQCYIPKSSLEIIKYKHKDNSTVGLTNINVVISKNQNIQEKGYEIVAKLDSITDKETGFYNVVFNDELNQLNTLKNSISQITLILMLASASVGGIGVMNIMYMSVSERKREIGVRRAIGAKPRNILAQFIAESVIITSIGGIIGVVLGTATSLIVSNMLPFNIIPTVASYIYAVAFVLLIGVVFGIIPAIKASKLDPIKAIQG